MPRPYDEFGNVNPDYEQLTKIEFYYPSVLAEYQAMQRAANAGMLIVIANGNERQTQPLITGNPVGAGLYPFIKPSNAGSGIYQFYNADGSPMDQSSIDFSGLAGSMVAVAALDRNLQIANYSNWCGVAADWCISAPGSDIYSAWPQISGVSYNTISGTSMATPHVSGAAAVLMQAFPFLTAPQIAQTMFTTATPIGPREIYGWGLLNLGKAIDGPGQFTSTWTVDTQGYYGRFANDISGIGGLIKTGAGTLELTGTNSYLGGTAINGGNLAVSRDASLGAAGTGLAFGGGTLQVTADGFASGRAITVNSSATFQIDLGGSTLTGLIADGTASGSVMKTGAGTLTLTGANTYTGVTTIAAGTLALAGGGSVSTSSGVTNAGTFDISGVSGTGTSVKTISGAGTVALGSRTLTVANGQGGTLSGAIAGTGGLTLAGGSLALTGTSSYTGATTVSGGSVLWAASSASLGDAGNSLVLNNGTLRALGDIASPATRAVSLAGPGTLDSNGLTIAVAGAISGTGGLTKAGPGALVLSGANTFSGGLAVAAGTATLAASGSLVSGASVAAGAGLTTSGQVSGGVSNAGALTVAGGRIAGGLTNTGAVTASAGRIDGGIANNAGSFLVTGSVASDGAFTNAAPALLGVTSTGAYTVGGLLTNLGSLIVAQGGSLQALGGLDNQGYLELPGGPLQLTSLTGSAGSVLRNVALTVNGPGSSTFAGSIVDGAGQSSLTKSGSGTLTLTGGHSYSGPTVVAGGTLSVNGSIVSPVTIAGLGTLRGTGYIAAPVLVSGAIRPGNSPGTLTVAGPVTFAAGSTLGLDIDGTGTGTGAGNYSRLLAVGPTGTIAANGTLQPVLRGITGSATNTYSPVLGQRFGVVGAAAGLTGSFSSLTQPAGLPGFTRFDALYSPAGLDLVVTPGSYANLATLGLAQNGNARAVGAAIDAARPAAGTRPDAAVAPFLNGLYAADPATLGTGLAGLSGQSYADAVMADLAARRLVSGTIDRHLTLGGGGVQVLGDSGARTGGPAFDLRGGVAANSQPLAVGEGRLWADGVYGFGDRGQDRNAAGARFDAGGLVVGIDRQIGAETLVGGAFTYLRNVGSTDRGAAAFEPGRFTVDSYGGALYGRTRFGALELRGSVSGSYADSRIDRTLSLGSFTRRVTGRPGGGDFGVSGFAGYVVSTGLPVELIPEVGFSYDRLMRGRASELGGVSAIQGFRTEDLDAARTLLGGRVASLPLGLGGDLKVEARAYWTHEFADTAASVQTVLLGLPVTARSSRPGRDGAMLGAGVSGTVAPGLRASLNYTGEIRPGATAQLFSAGLEYRW